MKKTISIIIFLVIIMLLQTISSATTTVELYSKEYMSGLLKWNDITIGSYFVVYKANGVEYPAYCLNRELGGVTDTFRYTVDTTELLTNVKVWRTVINGYPYKSYQELGCATPHEAFLATKQAVYCALYDRDPNTYSGIGVAGARVLKALKTIVYNAENSKEVKASANFTITSKNTKWEIDNIDNKYISRTFTVTTEAKNNGYTVELENMNIEGYKIVNLKNEDKLKFNSGENFKILLPIKNLDKQGNFTIKVSGKVDTKPIIYGKSTVSSLQDNALVCSVSEDGTGSMKVYYSDNSTKVIIVKQEKDTEKKLSGVKFELLNENKEVIYMDLVTDAKGTITIKNLLPGKYFIKETKTGDDYILYPKEIEINLKLNEITTVIVNNNKKQEDEIKPTESEVQVEYNESKTEIQEKNVQNITEAEKKVQIEKEIQNTKQTEKETQNIKQIEKETQIEKEKDIQNIIETEKNVQIEKETQKVVQKLPKTGM